MTASLAASPTRAVAGRRMLSQPASVATVLIILLVANILNNHLAVPMYVATSLVAAGLILMVYRLAGGTWQDVGLGRRAHRRGATWALGLTVAVAVCCLAAIVLPATRALFLDPRVEPADAATIAYQTLVRIPLGTVLLEEIAFRGVLYGLIRRTRGVVWATAVSCGLFALWHIPPALHLVYATPALTSGKTVAVTVLLAAAALAGLGLCELRRRSGSLLAPAGMHWATNALGYLTAVVLIGGR